jgi:hypothetical protein
MRESAVHSSSAWGRAQYRKISPAAEWEFAGQTAMHCHPGTDLLHSDTDWTNPTTSFDTDWTVLTPPDMGLTDFLEVEWRCDSAGLICQACVLPDHNVCKDSCLHPTHCHNADKS